MLVLGVQALIRVFVLSGGQLRGVIQPGNRPQDGRAVSESARVLSAKQSGHFSFPCISSAAGVHPPEVRPVCRRNEVLRVFGEFCPINPNFTR